MFQRYYKRAKVMTLRIYYNSLKMRKLHWSRKTQKTQRLGTFDKEKACRPLLIQLQSVEAKITF